MQVTIQDLRDNYPQYVDLTDEELAEKYSAKTGMQVMFPNSEPTTVEGLLPEAGTYSQDDMVDDSIYPFVEEFMLDRYGTQSVKDRSREDVVDMYLNNRRGVSVGNTVRGLSEMDYINNIQDNPDKTARAAAAYKLYENMAPLYSKETDFGEKVEGTVDFIRSAILDPSNLLAGFLGRAAAGGSIRVGTEVAKRAALDGMKKQPTKQLEKTVSRKIFADGLETARKVSKQKINDYAQQTLGKTAKQRLLTKSAIAEVVTVASVDAAIGTGMEYLYQDGLVDVDAQEDINYWSVGIAALGGIVLGGLQVGFIARRGKSDTAVQTVELPEPESEGFLSEASKAIGKYLEQDIVPIGPEWKSKVEGGYTLAKNINLQKGDTPFSADFAKTLLLGHTKDDKVVFKGMTQIAYEKGFVWAKRFEGDRFTNWMADIIADVGDKEARTYLKSIEKAIGNKITIRGDDGKIIPRNKVTGKDLGDILAFKLSEAGATLGAAGQSAKQLGLSISDLELKDLYESAIDAGFVKTKKKPKEPSIISESFAKNQNRLIRLLVSHPSTSALNVIGWGTNTALQSVSDITLSLLLAGRGTIQKLLGDVEKGAKTQQLATNLIKANAQRVSFLFDPDMTYTAFESALQRNSNALEKLNSILPGGVEGTNRLLTDGKFSVDQKLLGMKTDAKIDFIQKLTLVQAQDLYTKSQEFLFQMDKKLRMATGKGWNEFYRSPDAAQYMATKEYRNIEASAVDDTLEAIFSKSYKGRDTLGTLAGYLEDARNIPGLGMAIPFGRFFNNTIAFMGKNTPGLNMVLRGVGYYDSMAKGEAFSRSLVNAGILYTLSNQEIENVKEGLPVYTAIDPMSGQLLDQKYDFPVSAYRMGARILALSRMGESQQAMTMFGQFSQDFGASGLLRNLDTAQRDTLEAIKFMIDPERRDMIKGAEIAGTTLASQFVNPILRPIEPLNIIVGIAAGPDAAPIDRKQNNKLVNNAFRYIDNIIPLFTGERLAEPKQTAAGGKADIQTTKMLGARTINLTDTKRVMARMGLRDFTLDLDKKVKDLAPAAANTYHGIFHDIIEAESSLLLESTWFESLPQEQKLRYWKNDVIPRTKELSKSFLRLQSSGPDDVTNQQFEIASKYNKKDISKGLKELNLDDFDELEYEELFILERFLETQKDLQDLSTEMQRFGG